MTSVPMMDANLARSGNAEAEMRSRQREIEQSRKNLNAGNQKTKEQKLRESCEGFEAMFIQKMWEGMRASLPQDGLMQSRDEKHWQGMYDQELGKSMARAGGIGLADMMVSQLSKNLQSASDVAASSLSRRRPMDIAPAPLLVEPTPAPASPAPVVAADPRTAGASSLAQQTGQQAGAQAGQQSGKTAGTPGLDIYSDAAAVAPSPDAGDAPAGTAALVGETGGVPGVATPPEVSSALTSLATLATQAEAARGVGQQAVNHFSGQGMQGAQAPGQGAPIAQVPGQGAQSGQVSGQAPRPGMPPVSQASASRYPQGVDPATVNAPPPQLPTFEPRTPVRTATNTRAQAPSDDVQHITRTQRQSTRTTQPPRAARTGREQQAQNAGSDFASNSASRTASPFTGQNMPAAPSAMVGDVATELLKSQLGDPTVKTKL